jgi:prepilin-type N-terminal cleavage/methylation domain-containing protein/prepilin-type processing-associated H-X9-DG protein
MKQRRGFTLIELLVVIAIISLLMAILLPALSKARKQSQATVCRSNLRQIGIAANLYAEAWNQFLPRGTSMEHATWFQLFMPYLGEKAIGTDYRSVKIYRCKSYPDKNQTVCYVVNAWDLPEAGDEAPSRETDEASSILGMRRLANIVYIAENEDGPWRDIITQEKDWGWHMCDVWSEGHLPTNISPNQERSQGRRVARQRHSKGKTKPGSHYLFLDWHVEWINSDDVTVDMWRFVR